jgi:TFIIF-interacting CTD phosphatase-like protein
MIIKDISRFKNRDMKRTVLLDPKPVNFILSPDNGVPVMEYNAEIELPSYKDDPYIGSLIEELKSLAKQEDVRP